MLHTADELLLAHLRLRLVLTARTTLTVVAVLPMDVACQTLTVCY